jgi:hypothetical protein
MTNLTIGLTMTGRYGVRAASEMDNSDGRERAAFEKASVCGRCRELWLTKAIGYALATDELVARPSRDRCSHPAGPKA